MVKVVIAMSGGVDSSVAAALLKEQGYEVIGVTMNIWQGSKISPLRYRHRCYGPEEEEDTQDAKEVAQILGMPFYIFDLRKEYQDGVLDYFHQEYSQGRTPNPCVVCNERIKLGALLDKIEAAGIKADYMATGHYAQVEYDKEKERYLLKKAKDFSKDQSYFLFSLSQAKLSRLIFPLGGYAKEEIKRKARDLGLRKVCGKKESQDFGDFSPVVKGGPGPIVDLRGRILGEHKGIHLYTIGQRKGLGVATGFPLYVIAINRGENAITVGKEEDLYRDGLLARDLNWIAFDDPTKPIELRAKIRYRHQEAEAWVYPLSDGKAEVKFARPQKAITPGQAVVFYHGDIVVGGGWIEASE